ncbi:DUF817 family protein [Neomegalonema perideroedes]|uniref:DUF817 family protein n=1 Tax=Neomegalonema perideroedes TaxID=217219 RepID=UPI00037F1D4D|nr:DUF817 family protein [Neomegalonema perideroedes]
MKAAEAAPGASGFGWRAFLGLQIKAAAFGIILLLLIGLSVAIPTPEGPLTRLDWLFLAAFGIQLGLILGGWETRGEALTILVFHLAGTAMEIFKVSQGSWLYPDRGVFSLWGAPLFTGFMYAAVGSYLARFWRLADWRLERAPPLWAIWSLGAAAYLNFFAHHFLPDIRIPLFLLTLLAFGRTILTLDWGHGRRRIPFLLPFTAAAGLVWLAENFATAAGIWLYPHQIRVWRMVPLSKFGSWFLLLLLTFALVAALRFLEDRRRT